MLGLYIHIPFCAAKCDYCDFYSLNYNRVLVSEYVKEICRRLNTINKIFDTVYFGGGTPSLIGADNLIEILNHVNYKKDAEVTVEVNPKTFKKNFFNELYNNGFNRISIGLQSANQNELNLLTRKHSEFDVSNAVALAKKAGFNNISLDLMLGIENQTIESLKKTIDFCIEQNPTHLSCYMLKIEEGTPFSVLQPKLPDNDEVSQMYLFLCDQLRDCGFEHYEISNFAKPGFQSKHNNIYWECEEYIGLGPSAHSFINKKRYYYPNDIKYFLNRKDCIFIENGGDLYEHIMLNLRLSKGINFKVLSEKGFKLSDKFYKKLNKYHSSDLGYYDENSFRLSEKGFLVQNTILCDLLEDI